MSRFAVPSGSSFLFIGDSITDCERMAHAAPLGWGFVSRFTEMVTFHHPELDIRWLNRGVGGDVIADLRNRWDEDVVAHEPDWLAIMIGINDCHGNLEDSNEWAENAYDDDFRFLLEQVRPFTPRLVLLDPFYVAIADGRWLVDDVQRRILDRIQVYHRVVARLAREHDAVHVHTHDMFAVQLRYRPPSHFGDEPVHPYPIGHEMIALELYKQLTWEEYPVQKVAPTQKRSRRRSWRR